MKILLGCDPEVFVFNKKRKCYVPACGMVEGTKEAPQEVPFGAVQVDGLALEFNTAPASNESQWLAYTNAVYGKLQTMIPKDCELHTVPVAHFQKKDFDKAPKESKLLGCDPDFNAWTREQNEIDPGKAGLLMRTGAGHIHIGWTEGMSPQNMDHFEDCVRAVKQLDYYLGLYSLGWDTDQQRRTLYGQAGAFRVKPYGVEYRVLSNKWMATPFLRAWVYKATTKAMADLHAGIYMPDVYGNLAVDIINKGQRDWQDYYDIQDLTGLDMKVFLPNKKEA